MKISLLFLSLLFCILSFAQQKNYPTFAFSISAREWPINIKSYQPVSIDTFIISFGNVRTGQRWGEYIHDNKPRLGLDVKQKISSKFPLELQIANYITYAGIERFEDFGSGVLNKFKRDHFVDIMYSFKRKKRKWYVDAGIGAGLLNCNSKFSYVIEYLNPINNITEEKIITKSSRFFAPRLNIGIHKKNFAAYAMIHKTPNISFQPHPTIAIEFKGTYTINPLVKKIKDPFQKKVKVLAETQGMLPTFTIGISARQGPKEFIDYNKNQNTSAVLTTYNEYEYLIDTKARLSIDVRQRISKEIPLMIQFSNYFSFNAPYDHKNFSNKQTLKRDHYFDVILAMQGKKQQLNFITGLGIGLFNCGTKHSYYIDVFDISLGNFIRKYYVQTWRFISPKITLGVQKNRTSTYLNLLATRNIEFQKKAITFEFKTAYTLKPFKTN